MSPEKTRVCVAPPSVTRSSMIAEPRMWPASWKTAVTLFGDGHLFAVVAADRRAPSPGRHRARSYSGSRISVRPSGGAWRRRSGRVSSSFSTSAATASDSTCGRGLRGLVGLGSLVAVPALGELDLELRRVAQDDLREVDRRARGVDRPGVSGPGEGGNAAAVVEVGVGQQERVDRLRVEGERASGCEPSPRASPGTSRSRRARGVRRPSGGTASRSRSRRRRGTGC